MNTQVDGLGPPELFNIPAPLKVQRQLSKNDSSSHLEIDLSPTNNSTAFRKLNKGIVFNNEAVNVVMIGTGEYTTGYVNNSESVSDKAAGVVALTMFDLRRRNKINRIGLCGVNGTKFPSIRNHMTKMIGKAYNGLDVTVETFPNDNEIVPTAYIHALDSFKAGDAVTIFTPDDTHFDIAMAAISRGLHVMITKPAVKTLHHHKLLHEAALKHNVLVVIEVHKRWDPIYIDARDRIKSLGSFSYIYSYMSQPKYQLNTFKAWAGKSSDISYYLNSHHVDFHEWCMGENSRPIKVTALASQGIAQKLYSMDCEDTITLSVEWENIKENDNTNKTISDTNNLIVTGKGTAIYTSSWIAPKSDVHSQQRFFYMGENGEINVDQAHRGYNMADDNNGFKSVNPLFMKYTPSDGKFSGQNGYGYRSFEMFIDAVSSINRGESTVSSYHDSLASIASTYRTTAILEAGRVSLDSNRSVEILYDDSQFSCRPTAIREL
eukprot:gene7648-10409_t